MMERENIQKLLNSYMVAETTKEEEQLLFDYFSTHRNIPAEWQDFSILFRGIRQYVRKPYASYRRKFIKWSAAAAVIAFVFGTRLLLQHQEESNKSSDAITLTKYMPTPVALEPLHETITEEAPVVAEIVSKPYRAVRTTRSVKQKSKNVEQILKLLDETELAFSQATVQCATDIKETFSQDEDPEGTDCETNIFI